MMSIYTVQSCHLAKIDCRSTARAVDVTWPVDKFNNDMT